MVQKFFGRQFEFILVGKTKAGPGKTGRKKRKEAGILEAPWKRGERRDF